MAEDISAVAMAENRSKADMRAVAAILSNQSS
jgi:hypothetical protein